MSAIAIPAHPTAMRTHPKIVVFFSSSISNKIPAGKAAIVHAMTDVV